MLLKLLNKIATKEIGILGWLFYLVCLVIFFKVMVFVSLGMLVLFLGYVSTELYIKAKIDAKSDDEETK